MPLLHRGASGDIRTRYARACILILLTIVGILVGAERANSQSIYTWRSDAPNGSWADGANWSGGAAPGGYDLVVIDGSKALMTNNLTGLATNRHRIEFPYGSGTRTIYGTAINSLVSVNGVTPAIQSLSANRQVVNFPLLLVSDALITNGSSTDLVFSNTVDLKARALRIDSDGDVTLAGVTRSSGGLLTKAGPGALTLSGGGNNAGLGLAIEGGTVVLAKASGTGINAVNGPITVSSGTLRLAGTGGNQIPPGVPLSVAREAFLDLGGLTESLDSVEGEGTITNSGVSLSTLTIGSSDASGTFGGSIVDSASGAKVALTKAGNGILTLTGSNSYSGPTAVNGGILNITTKGAGRGHYTIGTARALGVRRLSPAGAISIQNLTANQTSTLQLHLGTHGLPTLPTINAATLTAGLDAQIALAGGIWQTGMFPVVTYNAYSGTFRILSGSVPPGVSAYLSNNITEKTLSINLTRVTHAVWTGAADSLWNTASDNWRDVAGNRYSENTNGGHSVIFDDTLGTTRTNVQLSIVASPINVQVNCTNRSYSFSGAGRISGSPNLTKNGPGTLRIATSNDYAGDTFINDGVLEVASPSALGATDRGTIVAEGATLQLSNLSVLPEPLVLSGEGFGSGGALRHLASTSTWTGSITLTGANVHVRSDAGELRVTSPVTGAESVLVVEAAGDLTFSNAVSTASLVKRGSGRLNMHGYNAFSGNVDITVGTLSLFGTNTSQVKVAIAPNGTLSGNGMHGGSIEVNGIISPGAPAGGLWTGSQAWNSGGTYAVDITTAEGIPGIDWDLLHVDGGIDIQAAQGQFTIKLVSRSGAAAGPISEFNNNNWYLWRIAEFRDVLTNFTTLLLRIDSTEFSNDLAGGSFVVETNGGLNLRFINNHSPVALDAAFTRAPGTTMKIAVSELLGSFANDVDGDELELTLLGASASGGIIQRDGNWILYTPPNDDSDDSFTYTIRDVRNYRPGDTVRTATANISITKVRSAGTAQRIDATVGLVSITFAGIPGFTYDVERSGDLSNWELIATIVNPDTGVFLFVDPAPPTDAAYYRLRQH